jgi:putative oxidoreductase
MDNLFKISRILYALTLAVFGVQHFMYAAFVATIVPGWIPWPLFWTYFVGIALIAAAISIVINKMARMACLLLGAMIFLFVILIHIPLVINNIHQGGKVTNMFKDVGLGCCAFILGYTFPKKVNV